MAVVVDRIAGGGSSSSLASADVLSWNADTGLSRISAGVVGVGNGTAGSILGTAQATTFDCMVSTTIRAEFSSGGIWLDNGALLRWGSGANIISTDTYLGRDSAGVVSVNAGTGTYKGASVNLVSANGAQWIQGQATELLTLSTGGTTTDTTANLLPAGAIIEAVVARVTTTITTATSWQLGDPTTAGRFTAANATMAAGTTDIGILHWSGAVATLAAGPSQAAAAKVRVTTVGTPGAGVIRITVFYRQFVAPTS